MKKEVKKIELHFNQVGFETDMQVLNNALSKVKKCQDAIFKITGDDKLVPLERVQIDITKKTGFKNILMSATLLEVADEYAFLETNLDSLDLTYIEFNNNIPSLKDSAIQDAKIANTSYLKDSLIADYELLVKATELLNQLSNPVYVGSLKADHLGKYKVSALQLNNLTSRG